MLKTGIFCILLFLLIIPPTSLAHPGNTASDGCHYCRTNCTSWGEVWNARHCHGGGSSYYNNYDYNFDSYDYDFDYDYNIYDTTPTCPSMSYYDSISGNCKCYSGYVVDTNYLGDQVCVSGDSYCSDLYGYHSSYDYSSSGCKCDYGHALNGGKCESYDDICEDKYGYNAEYNILNDKCECSYGYVVDTDIWGNKTCKDGDRVCRDRHGYNSNYNSLSNKCECDYGYELVDGSCEEEADDYISDIDWSAFSDILCPENSTYINEQCICNTGYVYKDSKCITHTDDCVANFGNNTFGIKGDDDNSICYCVSGYEWNDTSTACVKNVVEEDTETIKYIEEELSCGDGYVLFGNQCIKIPENAHAVVSLTDAWLCNDGYEEYDGACIFIEEKIVEEDPDADFIEGASTEYEEEQQQSEEVIEKEQEELDENKDVEKPGSSPIKSFFQNLFGRIKNWF